MLLHRLLMACFAAVVIAAPSSFESVVHEKRHISDLSSQRTRVAFDALIPVKIGLTQRNLDRGYDLLLDISHPGSPNYGKHWTADDVHAVFSPADETVNAVRDWVVESGVSADRIAYSRQGWLSFDLPARQAEILLQTEYYEYSADDGSVKLGCDQYSLPKHIAPHVDYIRPGVVQSPPMMKRALRSSTPKPYGSPRILPDLLSAGPISPNAQPLPTDLQDCGQRITPPCVFALYNISRPDTVDPSNVLGLYETGEAYSQDDLNTYFADFAPEIPSGTGPTVISIDNGTAPATTVDDVSAEANADLMIAYYLIYPQTTINYQDANQGSTESDYTWVTAMLDAVDGSFCTKAEKSADFDCGTTKLATVLSSSYATTELAYSTLKGQKHVCNEFMKLSLQGHTFLYASGDHGVAFGPNPTSGLNGCYDPKTHSTSNGAVFNPSFPSNCPYVLSVGATQIDLGNTVYDSESAMEQSATFSSSGGFSNYFSTPLYQKSAVQAYFAQSDPGYPYYLSNGLDSSNNKSNIGNNSGVYNRKGRGFPDVSANGVNFRFVYRNGTYLASGASLATPLWASVITLINENRTAQGKSPVGFVNPVLYANPDAFHDIQTGQNPGCGTNGFTAVPGWDPITGLGTPNFPALLEVFAKLP